MCSFLKGRRLWRYITGTIVQAVQKEDGDAEKFVDRLEEWDSKNHQIAHASKCNFDYFMSS